VAGWGVYSAFTATTTNSGNTITAGTVAISQHAGSTTLYSASNQGPGAATVGCVRVTYTGSLASSVKLYSSSVSNGTAFNLMVERGSGLTSPDNTMNCTGFSASSTAYNGDLGSFATTYAGGVDGKAGGAAWATNDAVDYRFTITVNDDTTPNAHTSSVSSGAHSFTWEARNN
jgi:lipoprotein-anchoring transpeptidase ErfK/SrfK